MWCLVFGLIACGETSRNGSEAHGSGGTAQAAKGGSTSGGSGSAAGGAASGGTPTAGDVGTLGGAGSPVGPSGSGGRTASGGMANMGGNGGTDAGLGASAGDGGFAAAGEEAGGGEAGTAGAGGSSPLECAGEYLACGCGCCGGTTPRTVCYYPDHGDSLASIKSEDQSIAMNSTCANAGCSLGTRYVCCVAPSEAPEATYETSGGMISADVYRISLRRKGGDERCQFVHIARGDGPGGKDFPIALPEGWILEVLEDYACVDENSADASKRRQAIGGHGSLGFVSESGECTLNYDFTLFFASDGAAVDAVRFSSEAAPSPDVPECG